MHLDGVRNNKKFLLETNTKQVVFSTAALQSDVDAGRATKAGEKITKNHTIEPVGIFFESVARVNPDDPSSPKTGLGRFQAEIWIMSWFGIDFTSWSKAQLTAGRFFFDALFPFLILFLLSFLTKPGEKEHLDKFYAKMYTPVQPTPEEESMALQAAYDNPGMYDKRKLFRKSNWEMLKPGRIDYIGFFGSWVLVGIIVFLLWLVVTIGK
jgi:SSS family solute:Na+ symporter